LQEAMQATAHTHDWNANADNQCASYRSLW